MADVGVAGHAAEHRALPLDGGGPFPAGHDQRRSQRPQRAPSIRGQSMACDDPIGLGAPPGRLPALSLSAGDSLGGTISDSVYWNVCDRVNRFDNRKFPK